MVTLMNQESKFNKTKYNNEWKKNNKSTIKIMLPKGQKILIQQFAADAGYKNVNQFIIAAIMEKISNGQ